MNRHPSQRTALLLLAALTFTAHSSFAERADEVTASVAAPAAPPAGREAAAAKAPAVAKLQPLTTTAPGKANVSKWIEDTRAKANARATGVKAQRQRELADGLAHEETSPLTPTTDTLALKLANGQVVHLRNFGTTDASVIGVNKIWPGGVNAASLNGGGITGPPAGSTIGQFEQNIPYRQHLEFSSPTRVNNPTSALNLDTHATSVAGVIIAAGTSAGAKGIAYQGTIDAYTWVDPYGEILAQAAPAMRVSNHSYGGVFGWDFTTLTIPVSGGPSANRTVNYFIGDIFANQAESPFFGLYDSQSRISDETAYLQPYQLIVSAAGNDRGQNEFAGYKSIFVGGSPYFVAQAGLITLGVQEDVIFNGVNVWRFSQGSLSVVNVGQPTEQIVFTPNAGQTALSLAGKPGADGGAAGFDTIPEGPQSAKNTLTVGSVTAANALWSVPQSTTVVGQGTVFGPTDDGRVKPDILANGVNVNTPKYELVGGVPQNNLYESAATGTSYSAAGVTGGVALLSELQERSVNFSAKEPLRAATLKGLILHTATDISTTGPDYRSGWGVAQIDKAASLIQANYNSAARTYVKEVVLPNNKQVAFTVRSNGSQPVKVTASWADPVAQPDPVSGLLPDQQAWAETFPGSGVYAEPTNSVLNNNIDVRVYPITDNTTNPPTLGAPVLPWKLNPASPAAAATRGQNDVDNVEQVQTPTTPVANTLYRVIVSQKTGTSLIDVDGNGSADAQPLSIIVTGVVTQTENFQITGQTFAFGGGNVTATLTWNSLVGGYYIIETSTNLSTWTTASGIFNTITESTTADSVPLPLAGPSRFFRVRKVSPNPFNVP